MPKIIYGTSGLGNLYESPPEETKIKIIKNSIEAQSVAVFDCAGKYGAGLALEQLGKGLRLPELKSEKVIISNKLGWYRTKLQTPEPTFEPGIWKNLKYDAVQKISYDGILECFHQGNKLLGGIVPQMVSVHDPDEYLMKAKNQDEYENLYNDILGAYQALFELKQEGKVKAIGIGAKNWKVIQKISKSIPLDWVMIATSMTIKRHPEDLLKFINELNDKGIFVINSSIFHSGFLVGGEYFDYVKIDIKDQRNKALIQWRNDFFKVCEKYDVTPAAACIQFALTVPGVHSIALNNTKPEMVDLNIRLQKESLPDSFWKELFDEGLVDIDLNVWIKENNEEKSVCMN